MKESLIRNKLVYVAIPKRLYEDEFTSRALKYIESLQPICVGDPRGMFKSNEEWLKAYPGYLYAYNCIIIVSDNGFIGKGAVEELRFFMDKQYAAYRYVEHQNIIPITELHIVDWNNWKDYARIV